MDLNTCDQCGRENASIQYTEVAEGQISKLHLCRSCAESHGLLEDQDERGHGIEALISKVSQANAPPATGTPPQADTCQSCKLLWTEFEISGLLGCEDCYKSFANRLAPLMRALHHGEPLAVYKRRESSDPTALLPELRALLEQAIRDEDYENAAAIRDKIQRAESKHGSSSVDESKESGE